MANRFATFELFVSQAVKKLRTDASWGRAKDLRKQCTEVLGALLLFHSVTFLTVHPRLPILVYCCNLWFLSTVLRWAYADIGESGSLTDGNVADFVQADKNISPPLSQDRTYSILQLLQAASDLNQANLQETCLGLLHKLVCTTRAVSTTSLHCFSLRCHAVLVACTAVCSYHSVNHTV